MHRSADRAPDDAEVEVYEDDGNVGAFRHREPPRVGRGEPNDPTHRRRV